MAFNSSYNSTRARTPTSCAAGALPWLPDNRLHTVAFDMTPSPTRRVVVQASLITLAINGLRLALEVQGVVPPQTGGALHPLGISWLVFAVGGWLGWRLGSQGAGPARRPALLWSMIAFAAMIGAVVWKFGGIDPTDQSDAHYEQLRMAVLTIVAVAIIAMAFAFWIWPRAACALFAYGVAARVTVVGITWLAKTRGWNTHYTKFGPSAIERPLGDTMVSASVAQLGFWIPFTVVGGLVAASLGGALADGARRHGME